MIFPSQVAVSTLAVKLLTVPPGGCSVTISPAGTIYLGAGTAVTTTTGAPISAPVTFPGFISSSPTTLYAIAASGTVPTGLIVSTAS